MCAIVVPSSGSRKEFLLLQRGKYASQGNYTREGISSGQQCAFLSRRREYRLETYWTPTRVPTSTHHPPASRRMGWDSRLKDEELPSHAPQNLRFHRLQRHGEI